jgi:uncharacterized DUF497 family protein
VRFEWDQRKAESNLHKHRVTFEEAATVFLDVHGFDVPDRKHSAAEVRAIRIGMSIHSRVLMVVHTERSKDHDKEIIRIVSARRANRKERAFYLGHVRF